MKKLMILGAGILQTATIKKSRELGYFTIALDGDSNAIGLSLANKGIVSNITNPEIVLDIAKKEQIDGIIHPCSEVAMNSMGYVNDKLNLKGIGLETAIKATNKEKMRRAFEKGGAPSPKSIAVKNGQAAYEAFININSNSIIKPSRNSGSRGVTFLSQNSDKIKIISAFERAKNESRDAYAVIEEYIDGSEFSVEALIWNKQIEILTVTDKLTTSYPYFIELGHSQPSLFPQEELNKIKNAAISGIKALDLKDCVAHAEIKLASNGHPYIMEIGARLGGDFISTELVHLSTGIDMVACAINIALGKEPDLSIKTQPQGAAIRYFTPSPGIVKEIHKSEQLFNNGYIQDLQLYIKEGDIIKPVRSSLDRSGHVITTGDSARKAVERAEQVINKISIITE